MFFGISQFNLSVSNTRYLNVETANISLVSQLYAVNAALNQVTYNTLYFAQQTCNGSYPIYDPINYICVATSVNCVGSVTGASGSLLQYVCVPCHYSCLTCSVGDNSNSCITCPTNVYRSISITGSSCPCDLNYTDVGVQMC